ncbi:class A beta-lactamase-related serine hydrolase [Trinickia fusca]|uniref:Class A beta-lactamase-related serine hydrolase n=2 Tax=Trinickia fusca TaxID=2419777 RepID=A0A494XUF3_9BURK|nr:class A beta-lactamase-related serine hydrolase [Trinickia fusca]
MAMDWKAAGATATACTAQWDSVESPGGGILVFDDKTVQISTFGGGANIEFGVPFSEKTVIRLASVTKHVVASLAMKLVDAGHLRLDAPLNAYLPQLHGIPGHVTVRGALDMTGGLADMIDTAWMLGVPRTALLDRRQVLDFLASLDGLNFPSGSEFSYSNAGYRLVEAAMEAQGIALGVGLREHLFEPLGVSMALPDDYADVVPGLAPGYWHGSHGWRHGISGMPYSGADGLCVSTEQCVAWLQALLANRGPAEGLLDRLSSMGTLSNGRATGVGFGLAHSTNSAQHCVGFVGGLPGYRTAFLLVPSLKVGVLGVANREDANPAAHVEAVLSSLLGNTADNVNRSPVALPDGRFVAAEGPDWLELKAGTATFLGTTTNLHPTEDGGFDSRAFYAPMTLRLSGNEIVGEVGHRFRHFRSVAADASPVAAWAGTWRHPTQNALFTIDVQDKAAWITLGSGPTIACHALTPLDARRAIFERTEGPRQQRVCLCFSDDFRSVLLATQRSRILRFDRC